MSETGEKPRTLNYWRDRAKDYEGRYETSHASRMWAEECLCRAER